MFQYGKLTFVLRHSDNKNLDIKISELLENKLCLFYISSRQKVKDKDCYIPYISNPSSFWKDIEDFGNSYMNIKVAPESHLQEMPEFEKYIGTSIGSFIGEILERIKRKEPGLVILEPFQTITGFLDLIGLPTWVVGPVYKSVFDLETRNLALEEIILD
jgi:hypothetical protein